MNVLLNRYLYDRFGYDSAFIGTTIARASFKASFNISASAAADISSNITSAFQAGAFFGAIFCYLRESPILYTTILSLYLTNIAQ